MLSLVVKPSISNSCPLTTAALCIRLRFCCVWKPAIYFWILFCCSVFSTILYEIKQTNIKNKPPHQNTSPSHGGGCNLFIAAEKIPSFQSLPWLKHFTVVLAVLFACGLHYYLLNTLENAHQLARQLGDVCVVAHTHMHTHIHAAVF